ncbi:hypothetical protein COSO111634_05270 [Corallococcus soli]
MVSTARLGPRKSIAYETRLATDAKMEPGDTTPSPTRAWSSWYWPHITPAKTPTGRFSSVRFAYPPSSIASQTVSRNSRSCGSMNSASRGAMRKKSGSNRSMPSRKPPQRVYVVPTRSLFASKNASTSQRSGGTSVMQSRPDTRLDQNASRSGACG